MRGTTVKRLHKMARNLSLGEPAVAYESKPVRVYPGEENKVRYVPGTPVRMEPNCTRRLLKNLKQDWKQNHNMLTAGK